MEIIWIILIGITLIFLANLRFVHTNYYKNLCLFENRIVKENISKDLAVINLGSVFSRFSFAYDTFNIKGYNFAQSPQSLWYDFMILKDFTQNLGPNCFVFINLPVFIFSFINYDKLSYDIKYYHALHKKYIKNYSLFKKILCTYFPIFLYGYKAACIFWDSKKKNVFSYDKCMIPVEQIADYAAEHHKAWVNQFSLQDTICPESADHLTEYMAEVRKLLSEMIDYCLAHGFRPVLITSPLSKAMNQKFSKEFLDKVLYDNIRIANTKEIPYLDLLKHPDFQEDPDMFWNGVDWLSSKGRKRFMELCLESIQLKEN